MNPIEGFRFMLCIHEYEEDPTKSLKEAIYPTKTETHEICNTCRAMIAEIFEKRANKTLDEAEQIRKQFEKPVKTPKHEYKKLDYGKDKLKTKKKKEGK